MTNDFSFYLARLPPGTTAAEIEPVLSEALSGGPNGLTWTRGGNGVNTRWPLPVHSGAAIEVGYSLRPPEQMLVTVDEATWSIIGGDFYATLLFDLSLRAGVVLGRTTIDGFHSAVLEEEIVGPLTSLHWFQFFSPAIASRWPTDSITGGPFARVLSHESGAVGIVLNGTPFSVKGRRDAAAHLGIVMRPLFGRNPSTGKQIAIPYD